MFVFSCSTEISIIG